MPEVVIVTRDGVFNQATLAQLFSDFEHHASLKRLAAIVKTCWQHKETKSMLLFLTLNFLFMFVELAYGVYSNSLGLISDAFHMLSDCLSLLVALFAAYIALTKETNEVYTFGYKRAAVLSGLFNGVFLIFVAFNVFIESIERIYEP